MGFQGRRSLELFHYTFDGCWLLSPFFHISLIFLQIGTCTNCLLWCGHFHWTWKLKKNYSRTDRGQMWLNHLIYITVNSLGEIFTVWKKMTELSDDILAPRVPLSRICQVLVEWEPTSVTTQWLEWSSENCFQLDSWQCLLLSQLPEHVHSIS